jgi:hypothetical protein
MTTPSDPDRGTPGRKSSSYTGGITDGSLAEPIDLRDFLHGVGTVFQLPAQRTDQKATKAEAPAPVVRNRRPSIVAAGAVIAVLSFLAVRLWSRGESHLPTTVLGEWTTSDPRYAGRAVRLDDQQVSFVIGGREHPYPVTQVRRRQAGDTTYLTIEYVVTGQRQAWPVAYVPTPAPALRPVNQRGLVWTRAVRSPAYRTNVP